MRLYCLAGHPSRPCFVLKFSGATIMLDCGLDLSSLLYYLPLTQSYSSRLAQLSGWSCKEVPGAVRLEEELKESGDKVFVDSQPEVTIPEMGVLDLAEVDVILLSNYHCMLALPYITEYSNFKGKVYATEPTLQIGRLYMEEMVEYLQRVPKSRRASHWKQPHLHSCLPAPLGEVMCTSGWRQCYNQQEIQASLAKVQTVAYNQYLDIFGTLNVTAISSGFCIGSCNWLIKSDFEKVTYVSGSSTLTTHPKPMDQSSLKNSDLLLLCGLTQTPTANPDAMIGEFCINTALCLKNGGNVLVPCYPSGVTYDLFECLSGHLDSYGLSQVTMYFISPVAASSLAYSNIYAHWLSSGKQSKVYLPEPPFPHAELVRTNRLKHFPHLHEGVSSELHSPCVVFTGHPSLRFGDVVHFMELWGHSSCNTIIFTEPDFAHLDALAPYQPLAMKVCHCPIDTSLNFSQANKLIRDLKPASVIVPEQLTVPPTLLPHRTDLVLDMDPAPIPYRHGQVLSLPLRRKYQRVEMDAKLAATLVPSEVKQGIAVATLTGSVVTYDNNCTLQPLCADPTGDPVPSTGPLRKQNAYVWGTLDVLNFVEKLKQAGLGDVKMEDSPSGGHIVHLPSEDTLIQLDDGATHIICQGNDDIRVQLRDLLLECLATF